MELLSTFLWGRSLFWVVVRVLLFCSGYKSNFYLWSLYLIFYFFIIMIFISIENTFSATL